jgi:hypothetical protein
MDNAWMGTNGKPPPPGAATPDHATPDRARPNTARPDNAGPAKVWPVIHAADLAKRRRARNWALLAVLLGLAALFYAITLVKLANGG